jgi:pSer/pThr/pTyr-binding forkhead associated (FHA) protein
MARRGAVVTRASAGFVLRNCGDKSMAHLDAPVPVPGDLEINQPKSVIGRQMSAAVNLPIEVPTVSGAHAMIDVVDGKVMVTDLTSTNGTFIDGEELLPGVPTQLLVGGEVIFGDEFLARFELVQQQVDAAK